jgi:two-component system, cell cycle sensor histidine kinase and response regulator CckA
MAGIKKLMAHKARVILLVDDDTQFLSLGQELLEYLGFQALIASQGDKALEIFRQRQEEIDLVIMDFNLPRTDGYQLLHQLQTIHSQVKVIVASGFFGQKEMDNFLRAGVAGMIHKPFRAQQLHEEIVKVLGD